MDCSPDGKTVRRLHAIHLLLIGVSFDHVVRNSRRSERTVRWWVEQFNAAGVDGLIYSPSPGRPRKMDKETVASSILPIFFSATKSALKGTPAQDTNGSSEGVVRPKDTMEDICAEM